MVSGLFRAYSGYRWERFVSYTNLGVPGEVTVRVEPRGARSLPAVKNIDLRISKDLPLPSRKERSRFTRTCSTPPIRAPRNSRSGDREDHSGHLAPFPIRGCFASP